MKTKTSLSKFVREACANFYQGTCLVKNECLVLAGKPCEYFEQFVLGPPDSRFKLPGYDYQVLFEQYGRVNSAFSNCKVSVRRCECGKPLQYRQRYCPECARRRRKATYRKSQRFQRLGVNS